jgi:hypothetical protein
MWLLDQLLVQSCLHQRMALLLTVSAVRLNGPRNPTTCDYWSWSLRSGFKGYCGTAWSFYCHYLHCLFSQVNGQLEYLRETSAHLLFFLIWYKEVWMRKINLNFDFCQKVKNLMLLFLFYLSCTVVSWNILLTEYFFGSCRKPWRHVQRFG